MPFWATSGVAGLDLRPAWAALVGILLSVVTGRLTRGVPAARAAAGPSGGLGKAAWAVLAVSAAVLSSAFIFRGMDAASVAFGVSMCGVGMLTLTGHHASMDALGSVSDSARGIGEMARLDQEARRVLADLDASGRTLKAAAKAIAIATAAIALFSLLNVFITDIAGVLQVPYERIAASFSLADPRVLAGLLIGGAVPFLVGSWMARAVGCAAALVAREVRRQLADKDIREGRRLPEYAKAVSICAEAAQKELMRPGFFALLGPLAAGILLGKEALGGFLAGAALSGLLLAVFAITAGKALADLPEGAAGPVQGSLLRVMALAALLCVPLFSVHEGSPRVFWAAAAIGALLFFMALREPGPGRTDASAPADQN